MNRMMLMFSVVASVVAVTGCSSVAPVSREQTSPQAIMLPQVPVTVASTKHSPDVIIANDGAGTVSIRKVEFRRGVSSSTVEKLAKQAGCTGGVGAGLITDKGPVEVYRMQCDNGTSFLAKCELRQCKPIELAR